MEKGHLGKRETQYWVVNGYDQARIEYCLANAVFIMQQQYDAQARNVVSRQLNKNLKIGPGDRVLLYTGNTYYAEGVFVETQIDFNQQKMLKDQIKNGVKNKNDQVITYSDSPCYYENLKKDNGFNGEWGQRLALRWVTTYKEGIHVPGIKDHCDFVQDTIIKLKSNTFFEKVKGILAGEKKMENSKSSNSDKKNPLKNNYPLNTILYGPPGTGKTYSTVKMAAEIIEKREISAYEDAQRIFNEHLGERIEFITFHQNYSYEDFIQGLRPDINNQNSSLAFERQDGVFMRMAVKALYEFYKKNQRESDQVVSTSVKIDPNEVYLNFVDELKTTPDRVFPTKSGGQIRIHSQSKRNTIYFAHVNSTKKYTVSWGRLSKLFTEYSKIEMIDNMNDITNIIGGCNATVFWAALNAFINFYNQYKEAVQNDPERIDSFNEDVEDYADMKELLYLNEDQMIQEICSGGAIAVNKVDNYVLIIDEINRANISRVFGELITLIEPDKRSHGEYRMICTLPSGERFVVPSNLYLIGTMNTADKSIALLDIALRRRFDFQPMYPDYNIAGLKDADVLKKINDLIVVSKGHDFQIGHSYFMGEMDLVERMNRRVIPLLLEYYMNDKDEVQTILDGAGLAVKKDAWPLEITGKK